MGDRYEKSGKRLAVTPCKVKKDGSISVDGDPFELMLNPASWKHRKQIRYVDSKELGKSGNHPRFSRMNGDTLSFDYLVDCTGVTAPAKHSVRDQIDKLEKIIYTYNGNLHEPRVVRLLWGTLIFFGRLQSLNIEYTLFKPDGEPLRAKVALSFTGFMSTVEMALRANRSSPDLSHLIVVKAGDTLPLLCEQVYEDGSYYPEVARYNGLTEFRHLEPGMRLAFPPLRREH
ncbi:CIS tube protein [Granulosicoccus sp. 3-233]|uniref:CIS tube protein n=1 Tax=Granulosicoccus sp. 3-233 TaxID=3417969 RepID=UPI003D351736